VSKFDNTLQEFIVEVPSKKNSSAINQLRNAINVQQLLNHSNGVKIALVLNSPDFDVQRGSYMIENLISFQRSYLPPDFTEK